MTFETKPIKDQWGQLTLLAVLGAGLAYALYTQVVAPATGGAPASNGAATTAAVPATPATLPTALKLMALDPVAGGPAVGRNPFRYGEPPRPAAPARPVTPSAPVKQLPPGPPPPPPGPPPPPAITLKFVAILDLPGGGKVASLSDGKGVFLGREGDVIDGRFRIVRIGLESIVMEYVDGRGRQTIPLRGTES